MNSRQKAMLILRYMAEGKHTVTNCTSPRKVMEAFGLSETDFDNIRPHLKPKTYTDGTMGIDGMLWITADGENAVEMELANRPYPLTMTAEALLIQIVKEEPPLGYHDTAGSEIDKLAKQFGLTRDECVIELRSLEDYRLIKSTVIGKKVFDLWPVVSTEKGRQLVKQGFGTDNSGGAIDTITLQNEVAELKAENQQLREENDRLNSSSVQAVFLEGKPFDAKVVILNIIKAAKQNIKVIDGYVNHETLGMLSEHQPNVGVQILTKPPKFDKNNQKIHQLRDTVAAYAAQHGQIEVRLTNAFHDRYIIIDDSAVYHFGHSFKDAGKTVCSFSQHGDTTTINVIKQAWQDEWNKNKTL